ncbi:MAG: hypothetical protein JXR25_01110 [Pontiellaceae bacterium]|nr:hypothetical protein [Pontiellaceae bacterium]MBN2783398.1 hypothetical protein [Pontiellaceae bacterium]
MLESLKLRDALMQRIRAFFHDRSYIEVETPIRLQTPCMELYIDAEPCGDRFLRTSPEIFHKQLLAAGCERIFEVGKCFRQGEFGALHNPEYTMLEWYQAKADYIDILEETRELIRYVWDGAPVDWAVLTVADAFGRYAGWDPVSNYDEDRFDLDLVEKVEPALKDLGGAVVLKDYPLEAAALSRRKECDPRVAERWELYIDGVELANAYSELTDPIEQLNRFEACAARRREMGRTDYGVDDAFIDALGRMPPSGGVALGVDRLLMLIAGRNSLDGLIPFR